MTPSDDSDGVRPAHQREIPPKNAYRECGICGGTLQRMGRPDYHQWRGQRTVCVMWECEDCDTAGTVLRDPEDGTVLRLPHVVTGTGFEVVDEDDPANSEAWRFTTDQ